MDDVLEVFVTKGTVFHGLFHGGHDLGFSEEVPEPDDFFELMGDMEFRFGHGLEILFC